jgi:hypothetical protein
VAALAALVGIGFFVRYPERWVEATRAATRPVETP